MSPTQAWSSLAGQKSRSRRFGATGKLCAESFVTTNRRRTLLVKPCCRMSRATRFLLTQTSTLRSSAWILRLPWVPHAFAWIAPIFVSRSASLHADSLRAGESGHL